MRPVTTHDRAAETGCTKLVNVRPLLAEYFTKKLVIGDPPIFVGSAHPTVTWPLPANVDVIDGALGTVACRSVTVKESSTKSATLKRDAARTVTVAIPTAFTTGVSRRIPSTPIAVETRLELLVVAV